ncbi:hypothetical protein BU16DRAFT_623172 [Lophium mytilinum]|uniref:Pre-mRNA-splicing factor 38B n=1 Tax=Lophium mytilinum TaxID=390894 RepID=A0A6A6QA54_9PEZI|nr:hypothetical protein BU16DRAFT_623172 [Lophium mytilinum]
MPAEGLDDEYVVSRLKSDAADSAKKYELVGLEAYMPKSRPTMGAPKPNTRFLRNIIRETDNHNAALLAKEAEDAKNRLKALRYEKEGRLSPYVSDMRGTRGDREYHRPSKRRREEEGEDEKDQHRKRRSGESGRHRDRRDRSQDRYRRHASSRNEETRKHSSRNGDRRREKGDTLMSEEDEETGEASKHSRRRHRSQDRRRRHRSRSESAGRNGSSKRDSHRDRRRRRSRSPSSSSSRSRSPTKSQQRHKPTRSKSHKSGQAPRSPVHTERACSASPDTKHVARKPHASKHRARRHHSPTVASDSDPLDAIIGPAPPPPPPEVRLRGRGAFMASSAMDDHFSASYDPTADVQPNSDVEGDWDEALEAMRDRQKWKQQGADRLRAAGFTDTMVKKWENGGEKTEEDVVWAKKGEGREWDRGKVVDGDGLVDVKAEWGRLKDTY